MDKFNVNVTVEIDSERVGDLLCTAFESGYSKYWGATIDLDKSKKPEEKTEYRWQWPLNGGSLFVYSGEDYPDDPELSGEINLDTIRKGLALMAKDSPRHMSDFLDENEDAITGDVFLQYVLFGKLIYG